MSTQLPLPPPRLAEALDLLRATIAESERRTIPPEVTSWAMAIESIDRLVKLHGAAAIADMLVELARLTREGDIGGAAAPGPRLSS